MRPLWISVFLIWFWLVQVRYTGITVYKQKAPSAAPILSVVGNQITLGPNTLIFGTRVIAVYTPTMPLAAITHEEFVMTATSTISSEVQAVVYSWAFGFGSGGSLSNKVYLPILMKWQTGPEGTFRQKVTVLIFYQVDKTPILSWFGKYNEGN